MSENEQKRLLWADAEHMRVWESSIRYLNNRGFTVTKFESTDIDAVLSGCKDKTGFVLHCGTVNTMENMADLLAKIKQTYPEITVGLQTNVKHPAVEGLVDFYIRAPIRPSALAALLSEVIK